MGTQINDLEQKEEINIRLEQSEETRIRNDQERLRNLWDNFKHSNLWTTGMPEGEEEEQEIGNLSEKIVKEDFPNLVKKIGRHVQETQRVPNKMDPKRTDHTKTHHN